MKIVFLNPQQEMGGIQCLSAFVKQDGHTTALINDPNLLNNPWVQFPKLASWFEDREKIVRRIEDANPDLIAMSAVTDDFPWALKWAREIKARMSVPIVLGNTHATFHPEEVLGHSCIDYIVRGEGELTFMELVTSLDKHQGYENIEGLGYRQNGRTKINPMRPLIDDLDILPFPDKDLYYGEMPYLNLGYTTMSGRGCPYKCSFCDNTTSTNLYRASGQLKKWARRHSPEYMVNEILWAKEKYEIPHVRFNDEDFSYDKKWIREFAEIYKEKVKLPFFAWVYPNTIDREMARVLADAGCDAVEMGIQSGSARLRSDIMKRNTKDEQITSSMKALNEVGIKTTVDIILGVPSETEEDLKQTVRLLLEGNPWMLYTFWLRYYPATQILQIAKERRLLTPEQIMEIETGQFQRGTISGGSVQKKPKLTSSYHTFITLLPLMPSFFVRFCLRWNLIRFTPSFVPSFLLTNFVRTFRPDDFNEFTLRGRRMLWYEGLGSMRNLMTNMGRAIFCKFTDFRRRVPVKN